MDKIQGTRCRVQGPRSKTTRKEPRATDQGQITPRTREESRHIHVEREAGVAKYWLNPVRLQSSGGFSRLELSRIRGIIDENISVEGLLAGRPSGENQTSFKRWLQGRQSRPTSA